MDTPTFGRGCVSINLGDAMDDPATATPSSDTSPEHVASLAHHEHEFHSVVGSGLTQSVQPSPKRKRREALPRTVATYPRKRAVAACHLCRARKIKCNNARPSCGSCLASAAQCVYEDAQDQSSLDPASILILDKLNQVLSRLDNVSPAAASNSPGKSRVGASPGFPPLQDDDRSQNQLRFPQARTTADAILKWPIFENRYPPDYITDALFLAEAPDEGSDADADDWPSPLSSRRRQNSKIRSRVVDEDAIPGLVQRFIDLVHIKNPILDVDVIWALTRRVVDDGFAWNMDSCLVLITAALGCVAQPFGSAVFSAQGVSSLEAHADALQQGEAYYYMARRRLGLLDRGIRVTQCHFLVGVYLMYTMRPLSAWSQFRTASESYRIYLECKARYLHTAQQLDPDKASKRRRMEQRLYWSCYKSECEMRSEINLPDSLLADCEYPDSEEYFLHSLLSNKTDQVVHPSPPDAPRPVPGDTTDENIPASWNRSRPAWLHRHHEQSWFYYLTDITLRRIINRILNIMYAGDHASWTAEAIPLLAKTAEEFERQLEEWYDNLPTPIQSKDNEVPTEELPYIVHSRILETKSWVYRPFLYYVIHNPLDAPHREIALPYAEKALHHCLDTSGKDLLLHRHHGTFYVMLKTVGCALLVLGAVKSGRIPIPLEWRASLLLIIEQLRFWEDECPSVARGRHLLQDYMSTL